MTTYSHTLTMTDSERITLEAALALMLEECEKKLANGAQAPFWAHSQNCESMLKKLRATPGRLMSSSRHG